MKTILKLTLKLLAALAMLILLAACSYYCFYKWRQGRQYADKITITAWYKHYACGDCSVDMEVETVSDTRYNFIVGRDVFPTPQRKDFDALCSFIDSADYRTGFRPFIMVGHLHKHAHSFPVVDCSETPYFTVEKIKHGEEGVWVEY